MAQVLKDEVQERIAAAALDVFAAKGFSAAGLAEIARLAGISTGNVYRYFENKAVLFEAVVPASFARELAGLIRRRAESLAGIEDVAGLGPDAPWRLISEELLRFCIDNRLRVVILLGHAEGTTHEGFAEKIVRELVKTATAHGRSIRPGFEPSATARFVLEEIYRNFVGALVRILERYEKEAPIREAVERLSTYHLAGLQAFLVGPGEKEVA